MPTLPFQFSSSLTQSTLREQDIVRISKDRMSSHRMH